MKKLVYEPILWYVNCGLLPKITFQKNFTFSPTTHFSCQNIPKQHFPPKIISPVKSTFPAKTYLFYSQITFSAKTKWDKYTYQGRCATHSPITKETLVFAECFAIPYKMTQIWECGSGGEARGRNKLRRQGKKWRVMWRVCEKREFRKIRKRNVIIRESILKMATDGSLNIGRHIIDIIDY